MSTGFLDMGLCLLVMVDTYTRPSEMIDILANQFVVPVLAAGFKKMAIHLNPEYLGKLSKTGGRREPTRQQGLACRSTPAAAEATTRVPAFLEFRHQDDEMPKHF